MTSCNLPIERNVSCNLTNPNVLRVPSNCGNYGLNGTQQDLSIWEQLIGNLLDCSNLNLAGSNEFVLRVPLYSSDNLLYANVFLFYDYRQEKIYLYIRPDGLLPTGTVEAILPCTNQTINLSNNGIFFPFLKGFSGSFDASRNFIYNTFTVRYFFQTFNFSTNSEGLPLGIQMDENYPLIQLTFKNFTGVSTVHFINFINCLRYRDQNLYTNQLNSDNNTSDVFATQVVNSDVQ